VQIKPLSENMLLARMIELGFAKAKKRFPYWSTDLSGLTPVYVDIPEGHKEYEAFSFAVTERGTMLVSDMLLRLGWQPEAVATVIVHELMHIYFRHGKRAKALGVTFSIPKQAWAWGMATDCEINDDLKDAGCVFPVNEEGKVLGVFPEDFEMPAFLTAEEYYVTLMNRPEGPNNGKGNGGFTQTSCGGAQGDPTEIEKELSGQLARDESDLTDAPGGEKSPPLSAEDGGGWDKTDEEVEAIIEAMTDAVLGETAKNPGNVPAGFRKEAEARRGSTVNWRAQLGAVIRRACTSVKGSRDANWSRPARRALGQFLRPTATKRELKVVLALDTSASMGGVMEDATMQIDAILKAAEAKLTYVQCDRAIAQVLEVRTTQEALAAGIKGWGGTDFRPVFHLIDSWPKTKRPDIVIYLTDGEGDAPDRSPPYRTIWAVVGESPAPADWGVAVRIPRGG